MVNMCACKPRLPQRAVLNSSDSSASLIGKFSYVACSLSLSQSQSRCSRHAQVPWNSTGSCASIDPQTILLCSTFLTKGGKEATQIWSMQRLCAHLGVWERGVASNAHEDHEGRQREVPAAYQEHNTSRKIRCARETKRAEEGHHVQVSGALSPTESHLFNTFTGLRGRAEKQISASASTAGARWSLSSSPCSCSALTWKPSSCALRLMAFL
eukprot:607931-Pelagomonas_calceolata.AAC.6